MVMPTREICSKCRKAYSQGDCIVMPRMCDECRRGYNQKNEVLKRKIEVEQEPPNE
jgi:hypothetical protein